MPQSKIPFDLYPDVTRLGQHCGYATLGDGDMMLMKIDHNDRKTVDLWIDHSADIRRQWPARKPLLILVDTSELDFALSPYFMRRAGDMMAVREELTTYVAWVIKQNFVGQLMRAMIGSGSRNAYFGMFYSREEAALWLLNKKAEHTVTETKPNQTILPK